MTHTPSESERRYAASLQALTAVFLFIPPLVAWQMRPSKTSPYVKYWCKTCLIWSLFTALVIAAATFVASILGFPGPAVMLVIIHFVVCIVGSLSSYFNTPYRYWFIARMFCGDELGHVYGQLTAPPRSSRT